MFDRDQTNNPAITSCATAAIHSAHEHLIVVFEAVKVENCVYYKLWCMFCTDHKCFDETLTSPFSVNFKKKTTRYINK